MSSPQINDELVTIAGSWHTAFTYRVKSISGSIAELHLWQVGGTWWTNNHAIQYDTSTGIWSDVSTMDPKYFTSTSTAQTTTSTSSAAVIYLWDSNQALNLSFNAPTWAQPSGGTSGGGGTSTEGVQTTEVATFDWDCKTCVLTVTILADAPTDCCYSFVDETNNFIYLISHTQGTDTTYSYTVPGCSATVRLSVPRPDGADPPGPLYYTVKPCNKVFCNFW